MSSSSLGQMLTDARFTGDPFLQSLAKHAVFGSIGPIRCVAVNYPQMVLYVLAVGLKGQLCLRCVDIMCLKRAVRSNSNPEPFRDVELVSRRGKGPVVPFSLPSGSNAISFNPQGTYCCIWGPQSMVAVCLQRDLRSEFGDDSGRPMRCPAVPIGDFYAAQGNSAQASFLQVQFHPLSDRHLVVLTATSLLVLDVVDVAPTANQQILLRAGKKARGAQAKDVPFVAFAFGSPREWDLFTVYLLQSDGALSCLCPVVPSGCAVPRSIVEALQSLCYPAAATADEIFQQDARSDWLSTALSSASKEAIVFSQELSSRLVPALQGPFLCDVANATASSLVCCSHALPPTCLVRSFNFESNVFVDSLIAVTSTLPRFKGPKSTENSLNMFLLDRLDLNCAGRCRLVSNPYDSIAVVAQADQISSIRLHKLPKLRDWVKRTSADPTGDHAKEFDDILTDRKSVV